MANRLLSSGHFLLSVDFRGAFSLLLSLGFEASGAKKVKDNFLFNIQPSARRRRFVHNLQRKLNPQPKKRWINDASLIHRFNKNYLIYQLKPSKENPHTPKPPRTLAILPFVCLLTPQASAKRVQLFTTARTCSIIAAPFFSLK